MLFSLLRCLRTRFSMILSQIWDGFGMFFGTFSWHFLCQKTCDRSSPPSAEKLFGAHFWHALGTKSAMTRTTHPQHSFSKGGGSAKRPQFAVPQRGAGVVLNGSVKLTLSLRSRKGFPSLPSRRPPQDRRPLPWRWNWRPFFDFFRFFPHAKKR